MNVKICGITRQSDALLAAELGAWAVGFIFHAGSPRYLTPVQAAAIGRGLDAGPLRVGVFVDSPPPAVAAVARDARLDMLQLHGHEDPAHYTEIGLPIIATVSSTARDTALRCGVDGVTAILVDSARPGTGTLGDWKVAATMAAAQTVILSGGLHAGNVAAGIAAVRPAGVDVASGVEVAPGIKDAALMRQFFAAVVGEKVA